MRRCRNTGRCSARAIATACSITGRAASGSTPSQLRYARPGRDPYADSIHPVGVGTEMPRPLSSQRNSNGTGSPRKDALTAALIAPAAVEWFAEASPNEHTTTLSAGHSDATPSRSARGSDRANPTARGRWEAMVEVCGMMLRPGCPNTLCRPPAIGSSAAPSSPCSTSRTGVEPGTCSGPRAVEATRAVVQQSRVTRSQRQGHQRVRLVPGRGDGVEASALPLQPAGGEIELSAAAAAPRTAATIHPAPRCRQIRRHHAAAGRAARSDERSSQLLIECLVRSERPWDQTIEPVLSSSTRLTVRASAPTASSISSRLTDSAGRNRTERSPQGSTITCSRSNSSATT